MQGLQGAVDLGISRIQLATDAIQAQQAIVSREINLSHTSVLIREIQEIVTANLSYFSCVHEFRECKKVAHALAGLSWDCGESDDTVLHMLPDCIQFLIAADISAS